MKKRWSKNVSGGRLELHRYVKIVPSLYLNMDQQSRTYLERLAASKKILYVLKSHEDFGGPQSTDRMNKLLNMKKKNLDSLISRLCLKGKIERISPGVYRYPGDIRPPKI